MDAGRNDIMKLRFVNFAEGTKVYFAVGKNLDQAEGLMIDDLENSTLNVGFPNSIYLVIEHDLRERGDFSFDFWYIDQDSINADQEAVNGFDLVVTEKVCKWA